MLQDFPLTARKNMELLSFFPQSYSDWNISSGTPAEAQGSSVDPNHSHVSPFPADSLAPLTAETCPAGLPVQLFRLFVQELNPCACPQSTWGCVGWMCPLQFLQCASSLLFSKISHISLYFPSTTKVWLSRQYQAKLRVWSLHIS